MILRGSVFRSLDTAAGNARHGWREEQLAFEQQDNTRSAPYRLAGMEKTMLRQDADTGNEQTPAMRGVFGEITRWLKDSFALGLRFYAIFFLAHCSPDSVKGVSGIWRVLVDRL